MKAAARREPSHEHHFGAPEIRDAYARWAPIYDLAFADVFRPGRHAAVAAAARTSGPILNVGVGTGLELPLFDRRRKVVAIDLSEHMLRRARRRTAYHGLHNVELICMDASRLALPDSAFGCVVAPFVLPVVPDPQRLLDEMARVTRPGGEIIVVNHVSANDHPFAAIEPWLGRHVAPRLGWRPQFPWEVIGDWIDSRREARLLERRVCAPFRMFTMARIGWRCDEVARSSEDSAPVAAQPAAAS